MNKNNYVIYILNLLLLISLIIYKNPFISSVFWLGITLYYILQFGYPRGEKIYKKNIIRLVIISIMSYFIIIYGLGLITGFSKNIFDLSIRMIISNTWHIVIAIFSQEIIRYICAKNSQQDKKSYILLTIIYIILTISNNLNFDFHNHEKLFLFFCLTFIPAIANNTIYSYLTYKTGMIPSLIIRLVFELCIYIFPIFPDLGNYLTSLFTLFYPIFLYLITIGIFKYYDRDKKYIELTRIRFIYIPLIIITFFIAFLSSGIGNHHLIVIATGSMEPIIYRGDAIIYKKNLKIDDIEIGNIIAYKKDGMIITHRVVGLDKKQKILKTKGDNNNTVDNYTVKENEVLGLVVYNIKYIGFPTIWLKEGFNK